MNSPLIAPATPLLLAAVAGGLLAALGALLLARQRAAVAGAWRAPAPAAAGARYLIGNLVGLPVVAIVLLAIVVGGVAGQTRLLMLVGALAAYLAVALAIPRRPIVERQRAVAALRALTPGFIAFIRIGLGSFESPLDIMRRYSSRPVARWAVMQALVADAIQVGLDQRMRPFAALALVARERGCRELTDVAEALAQAEAEGGRVDSVLEAQQATLELILQSEFKRMIRRRTMYLLMMVAVALVVGILGNILWIFAFSAIASLG